MKNIKCILLGISMAFLVASCSLNVDSVEQVKEVKDAEQLAVGFGVYVNRGVTTKAGKTGELTTATLKEADAGFGVFSYYGNGALYNETSKPDFMYNQLVSFSTQYNVWTYSPVKYWPNEYGAAASSEAADRLTFFAYAPYVAVTPSTGVVTDDGETGILGMSRNISAGDPLVMYGASLKPGSGVDLCWGVAADNFTSSVDGDNNNVEKGKPFIDVIKPKTGDRLSFEFNHALSQLNVQVDADINNDVAGGDDKTRIYVRSVTFNGFATRGSLNLNSNTTTGPVWYDISGTGKLRRDPVTVYDGRSDGFEGVPMAMDVNETPAVLSPVIIQSKKFGEETTSESVGVTGTPVNLFANADPAAPIADLMAPVMVVPIAGVPVSVTIVYDIETKDDNLPGRLSDGATHGISIENKITKTVQMDGQNMTLEAGKKYVISLHLGLTSVKFDAEVKAWDDTQYTGTVDLPINTASLEAISITDPATGNELTEVTVWKNETLSKPNLKVRGSDDIDLTDRSTITWESDNEGVATVASDGTVTINSTGVANIKVTATFEEQSGTKSYTLSVNEVTGISLAPATSNIVIGGDLAMKATLTINDGNGINGTIATWPSVTWSSNQEKVTVSPTSVDAQEEGSDIVATTTVTATSAAATGDVTEITATVGTPFASSDISDVATLTCVEKVAIASLALSSESTTTWLSQGAATPTVTVTGTDGNTLTSGVTLTWSSDNDAVATVTDAGVVTLHGTGTATLTVTAELAASSTTEASSKSADYVVYVNDVTGISVSPATSSIVIDGNLALKATLTINGGNGINGTIDTWPAVAWSSNHAKVTVDPASVDAALEGTEVVASVTATAAADAQASDVATISASVGTPYASSGVSDTSTLTFVEKIGIASVSVNPVSTTIWLTQDATTPAVTVMGTDGNVLTSGVTLSWTGSDNETVATVTSAGAITLHDAGTATLTVKAELAASPTTVASSGTADYTVYVNKVTAITLPATATVLAGQTATLIAEITHTDVNPGSISYPVVSWVSGTTSNVTVSSSSSQSANDGTKTTASMVVNGVAGGSSVVTASVAGLSASCTVTCATPSSLAFRGYWVSPGILYRDSDGNYGLTNVRDGDNFNPFELYDYFNKTESLNTYYFKWFNLRNELGADGNNIDADSDKLPAGWMFPTGNNNSSGIWNTIFNGVPKTEIKIGNTVLGTSPYDSSRPMPWAKVTVTVGDKSYYGVILLRDGAVVDFNLNTLGKSSAYSDNILSYTDLQKFLDERCLFISCSGYYNDVSNSLKGWKDLKGSYYEIDYWSSTYYSDAQAGFYLSTSGLNGATHSSSAPNYCMPVRLVKPATDMNP